MNNYDIIAPAYQQSHHKPDKQFSILPTVIALAEPFDHKIILDIGCGDGFFSRAFAKKAKQVIAIDNSDAQIALAREQESNRIVFRTMDCFTEELPSADVIITPFVFGYIENTERLDAFTLSLYKSTNVQGRCIGVVDNPTGADLRRYGAVKKGKFPLNDGDAFTIDIYNDELLCTLEARYYSKSTIERSLIQAGFRKVEWHSPIISQEGLKKYQPGFWEPYITNPELLYFTADK